MLDKWLGATLSESKRPLLLYGEVETLLQNNVAIYQGDAKTEYEKGTITLTTHRLIWLDENHKLSPACLPLSLILSIEDDTSYYKIKSSPKIRIILAGMTSFKLSFRSGGKDQFYEKMKHNLSLKSWEKSAAPIVPPKPKQSFTTESAGIHGILREQENRGKKADETLQEAFTDLKALMEKAGEMVNLAERLSNQMGKSNPAEDNELKSALVSMGIVSPVTKGSAGSLYHTELSKQLSDWLIKPLQERFGGMISLCDLYCFFNRARGTELISPDDLYKACSQFETLRLPLRMKKLGSGVLVVTSGDYNDERVADQIADYIKIHGPQGAFEISRGKNIPLALANEQLDISEKRGKICRDETFEGIVFYLNYFENLELLIKK